MPIELSKVFQIFACMLVPNLIVYKQSRSDEFNLVWS